MKHILLLLILFVISCSSKTHYDVIISNGLVYDGNGEKPFVSDVAIEADTIAAIGNFVNATAKEIIDAKGSKYLHQ